MLYIVQSPGGSDFKTELRIPDRENGNLSSILLLKVGVPGPAAKASPRYLLEKQTLRPSLEFKNQNLQFHKMSQVTHVHVKYEKH